MPPSLTLIVAATRTLGIGYKGALPWPALKSEMAYFSRVTKRIPAPIDASNTSPRGQNVVVMGRKTWESIPARFRPLPGRINLVVSRSGKVVGAMGATQEDTAARNKAPVVVVKSFEEAVKWLDEPSIPVERVFVIGGASLYRAALDHAATKRVLLTKVHRDYECDTFFPLDLDGEEGGKLGWQRAGQKELQEFVGEEAKEGTMKEADVEFEFCLYER